MEDNMSVDSLKRDSSFDEEDEMDHQPTEDPRSNIPKGFTREDLVRVPITAMERAKWIPLRLSMQERKILRLLEGVLAVSDYTSLVDNPQLPQSKRTHIKLKSIFSILSGLLLGSDYEVGQELLESRKYGQFAGFFQRVLEVGRRHKIMNPEKMRSEYGKLVFFLQDTVSKEIEPLLGFSAKMKIRTVYNLLQERDALDLLKDPLLETATKEILDDKTKSRKEIQASIKEKERAVEHLAAKYASSKINPEEVKLCLRSIGDNNSFLRETRDSIMKMIDYLTRYFDPDEVEPNYSLAITEGLQGSRLTHDHSRQFHYVLQSLTLWKDITNDMFRLWILAEDDLLNPENDYQLRDTGQGFHRVQQAPNVRVAMNSILNDAKRRVSSWIGSEVIHLGDHNVPNVLVFIDKYTQVVRIINPILCTLQNLDHLVKDQGMKYYIETTYGGVEKLRKDILLDFFRSGFDGSGADNFVDAGSCIDGRLTSAWNWCSKLAEKSFYPIFKLAGFTGFDGDFQK